MRNTLWYGNPVYPMGASGLVATTGQERIQLGPSLASGLANLLSLFDERIYDRAGPYSALLRNMAGWGIVAFAVGGASLVVGVRENARVRKLAIALGVSLASVLLLVRSDPWNLRFALFFPSLLFLAIGSLMGRGRVFVGLVCVGLAWQFFVTLLPAELPRARFVELTKLGWRERSMGRLLDIEIPADSIAFYVNEPIDHRGEAYLLYGPGLSRQVVYLRVTSTAELVKRLEDERVCFVYVSLTSALPDPLLERCVQEGLLLPHGKRLLERRKSR